MVSQKDLSSIDDGDVVLLLSSGEGILKENVNVLRILFDGLDFDHGVYITISRPFVSLERILKNNGIDTSKLYFIDCVSKAVGVDAESTPQCKYLESPSSLSALSTSITEVIHSMPEGKKFLFMDTLSLLLVYNSAGSIARFSHFLVNKIRLMGVSAVFMSVEEEMEAKLVGEISQFCDKTIRSKS